VLIDAELIKRLRAAPTAVSPLSPEILAAIVAGSVAQIRVLNTEITRLEHAIEGALASHPKASMLEDLPRAATVSLAQLVAEVGPLLDRCESPEQVAAIAPRSDCRCARPARAHRGLLGSTADRP
jgi:hypothetical protein